MNGVICPEKVSPRENARFCQKFVGDWNAKDVLPVGLEESNSPSMASFSKATEPFLKCGPSKIR
jgi:hypothetical protein